MRIAFFADIHGNLTALNAAIRESKSLGINDYILLGDYIGYYYKPLEVIKELLKLNILIMIKGNHEELLLKAREDKSFLEILTKKYGNGHKIALKDLSTDYLKMFSLLNHKKIFNLPNQKKMLICHGSPWEIDEYIYPDTPEDKIEKALENYNFVACGHSHYQFVRKIKKDKFLFNPGSIGQSRQTGKNGACWASFDTKNNKLEFFNTNYDKKDLICLSESIDKEITYLRTVLKR